ncbi:MAG: lipoyl(octanoyl) transferase LipB [Arachnia sp.]
MALTYEYKGLDVGELCDYRSTWDYQREVHDAVAAGSAPGRILLLEHQPVYTAGRRTQPHERPFDGTPVVDVDRGGNITYHGPGQLVGYPIIRLADGVGVVDYVRAVESAIMSLLWVYGLPAIRVSGRTGVWLPADDRRGERKICAIGVRVAKRTTMHGFALNVLSSAERFGNIVPCGISDAGVTSLAEELDQPWRVSDVAHDLEGHLQAALDPIAVAVAAH